MSVRRGTIAGTIRAADSYSSAGAPSTSTRTEWLTERGCNHSTDLLALFCGHEDWVEALGHDHGVGERINRCRWVVDDDQKDCTDFLAALK